MNYWKLARRSLTYHWRTNLGVLLSSAVCVSVLVGAMAIDDSIKISLNDLAMSRVGAASMGMELQDRFVSDDLSRSLSQSLSVKSAAGLTLRGSISNSDNKSRVNDVHVLGVDERFWAMGCGSLPPVVGDDGIIINDFLSRRLDVKAGDDIVLRIEKRTMFPAEAPLADAGKSSLVIRQRVAAVVGQDSFGNFSFRTDASVQANVFIPLPRLQEMMHLGGMVNFILLGEGGFTDQQVDAAMRKCVMLKDYQLELRNLPLGQNLTTTTSWSSMPALSQSAKFCELRSRRIFIDPAIASVASDAVGGAVGVLTYFVNEIRLPGSGRAVPYSMVTAVGPIGRGVHGLDYFDMPRREYDISGNDIVFNTWLERDLAPRPLSERVDLKYYAINDRGHLTEKTVSFRYLEGSVPLEGIWDDSTLMPEFPGIAEVDDCRQWDAGIPIDFSRIRDDDREYWKKHRGAPKAFVSLKSGQEIWGNRFGNLTAIRYLASDRDAVESAICRQVNPKSLGLYFRPIRQNAIDAGANTMDFAALFIGMSFFLVVASLVLAALVFAFNVESRSGESGVMLAMGFSAWQVRSVFLIEGAIVALLGGLLGIAGGVGYASALIHALRTIWRGAVELSVLDFHITGGTILSGIGCGLAAAIIAITLVLWRHVRRPPAELLSGAFEVPPQNVKSRRERDMFQWGTITIIFVATAILLFGGSGQDRTAVVSFFCGGTMMLIGVLGVCLALLQWFSAGGGSTKRGTMSLMYMAFRNCARRSGRSMAVAAMLACGVFLTVVVAANRQQDRDPTQRTSGTGGFALYCQSSLPVYSDLNSPEGRSQCGLDESIMSGIKFVQFRVHDGDDASCLNLNMPARPRLLGVDPEQLQSRGAFSFAQTSGKSSVPRSWLMLAPGENARYNVNLGNEIPAIGDQATVAWALRAKIDDELKYPDDRGDIFELWLVGTLENSVLQGNLIIPEAEFANRFPSDSGYRVFLVDCPVERIPAVSAELTRVMSKFGMEVVPASARLEQFTIVEKTYLSIFQLLGGLGLVLGSVGMAMVVVRNMMERRNELALIQAFGVSRSRTVWMLICEHWALLLVGTFCGAAAGFTAVAPSIFRPGGNTDFASLFLTLGTVLAVGMMWTAVAAVVACPSDAMRRGGLAEVLRNE